MKHLDPAYRPDFAAQALGVALDNLIDRCSPSWRKGRCRGANTLADDIRESIRIVNELCSNGREAACAAVAAGL